MTQVYTRNNQPDPTKIIDKLILKSIDWNYRARNKFILLIQAFLFNNKGIKKAQNILIFSIGSIGDSVCRLPAIASIRKNYPNAKVDILTNQGNEELVSIDSLIDNSIINNIINYLGITGKELRRIIKRNKYDLFIELPVSLATVYRNIRNMLFVKSFGIKSAFGWEIASVKYFLKYQEKYLMFVNERERHLNNIEMNGLVNYGLAFPLAITEQRVQKINDILKRNNLTDKKKNIAFVVGAKRPQNRWPVEYFNEVAQYLMSKDFNILLVGGKEDFELGELIRGDRVYNFAGKLDPVETALLLKNCELTISNDTGPMHLSYAVGTPVIVLFSSRDFPGRWYPPQSENNKVFRNYDVPCTMCFSETCSDNICMKGIKSSFVIDMFE